MKLRQNTRGNTSSRKPRWLAPMIANKVLEATGDEHRFALFGATKPETGALYHIAHNGVWRRIR